MNAHLSRTDYPNIKMERGRTQASSEKPVHSEQ